MPIIVNLDIILAQRRMSLNDLAEKMGMHVSNLSILKTNKARAIRFTSLDDLCGVLDCKPGDILDRVSEEEYEKLLGRPYQRNDD